MPAHFLSRRAHLCVAGEHLVILDLATGTYLGLSLHQATQLAPYIQGWPVGKASSHSTTKAAATLNLLLARGLLTQDPLHGKPASPAVAPLLDWHLTDRWLKRRPLVRTPDVLHFVASVASAAAMLRLWSLERIVARASARKSQRGPVASEPDTDAIMHRVAIYSRLRPWLYSRKDNCLLHSLALLEFLAREGIVADWIFGVRTAPFRAHAWLAYGSRVLTESPQSVAGYSPILAV